MRWVYLIAGIPFVVFAISGYFYGAFFIYMVPVILCLLQYFHPTFFGWIFFSCIFTVGSCGYSLLLIKDIIRYFKGENTKILIDYGDSLVFILLLMFMLITTYLLLKSYTYKEKNGVGNRIKEL